MMPGRHNHRTRWTAVALAVCLLPCASPVAHADQYAKYNNEGNRLAREGHLEEALNQYLTARVERPDAPEVDYNIGNVLHEQGVYDTALAIYQSALGGLSGPLVPETYYNMGNTLYRQGEFQSAIEAYKRALIANPDDQDAKFNLELAWEQMQGDSSQQQQQEKQDQEQQPDSTQQQQDQNQEQQPDSTQQQQPENQDSQQQQDQSEQPQQEQAEQNPTQQQPQGMTREDAERLLDALKQDELDLQKKRAQRLANSAPVLRDW